MRPSSLPCPRAQQRAAAVALVLALAGCIAVPVPPSARFVVPDERLRAIQAGQTTRTDVLLMLADPHARGERDAHFVYRWVEGEGGVGYLFGYPGPIGGGSYVTERCHDLVIQFDAGGRVARSTVFVGAPVPRSRFGVGRGGEVERRDDIRCDPQLDAAVASWLKQGP